MWAQTRAEAQKRSDERVLVLVREHEIFGEKVFVHKGENRTTIFKENSGYLFNSKMSQQQTLSLVEVPHCSVIVKKSEGSEIVDSYNELIVTETILDWFIFFSWLGVCT